MEEKKQVKINLFTVCLIVVVIVIGVFIIIHFVQNNNTQTISNLDKINYNNSSNIANTTNTINVANAINIVENSTTNTFGSEFDNTTTTSIVNGKNISIHNLQADNLIVFNGVYDDITKSYNKKYLDMTKNDLEIYYNSNDIVLKIKNTETLKEYISSYSSLKNTNVEIGDYILNGINASDVKKVLIAPIDTWQETHIDIVVLTKSGDLYTMSHYSDSYYLNNTYTFTKLNQISNVEDIEQCYMEITQGEYVYNNLDILIKDKSGLYYSYENFRRNNQ